MSGGAVTGGVVAAVDLGATSGRVMLGFVGDGELRLEPVARFPNGPVEGPDGALHWDFSALYRHVVEGLRDAVARERGIASVGIDSWAVDYGLVSGGEVQGEPFHYRDDRTVRGVEQVHAAVPFDELYRRNGLQFLPFNTLYQFVTERGLADADAALLVPDLVAFLLTGAVVAERTNASTTGLVDVTSGLWDVELAESLGIPASVLAPLVEPGAHLGTLSGAARERIGAALDVVAVGSHDTASAVVAVPLSSPDAAYISCGTWGLVGVELDEPVVSDAAREANFTNEGGVDGRVRFLHNVTGLWLLSEAVRTWEAEDGAAIDLPALLADAASVDADVALFDANDPRLSAPGDMPARIAAVLEESGAPVPATRAAFARTIVESIAQAFAGAVATAGRLTDRDIDVIHIVGGGSLNRLLCQATADRSGLPVLAGPVEATALGNVLVQARAHGWYGPDATLETLRAAVADAFPPARFTPRS
ncbi:rhamnulokinase [Microbacterium terrae]|uniref:Rhamnulokinase n=1 Tax=Microbacterium terrae TaxID=69369 RepID=A0A0M2HFH3_9MICO|nr:rhamnulokinase family protein [Microbacterium terrae]KJL43008.1 Rhamnulokinase [Microbacterium terrae]MBP1079332.1 rhamnulokinase [Microbacterium terrae]GLJ98732.1 rhamnulokinase [Microbacterium terrae]